VIASAIPNEELEPAANGYPGSAASTPFAGLIANALILPEPELDAKKNDPAIDAVALLLA